MTNLDLLIRLIATTSGEQQYGASPSDDESTENSSEDFLLASNTSEYVPLPSVGPSSYEQHSILFDRSFPQIFFLFLKNNYAILNIVNKPTFLFPQSEQESKRI